MVRIFLVEDEGIALRALKKKITDLNEDYSIVGTAANGLEAYGKILESKPDILITDIRMADIDGITLIKKLRESKTAIVPIIISGYKEFEYAQQALQLGVKDYLLKPVDLNSLKKCLDRCAKDIHNEMSSTHSILQPWTNGIKLDDRTTIPPYGLIYLIFSTPLSNPENTQHPNVPCLPNHEIEKVFLNNLCAHSVSCFDGLFSNEKIILLSEHQDESSLRSELRPILDQLSMQYNLPITACCTIAQSKDTLPHSLRICRKKATQNACFGKTILCGKDSLAKSSPSDLKDYARLFPSLLHWQENELLRANIKNLMKSRSWTDKTLLQMRSDLIFLLSAIRQSFPEVVLSATDCNFYIENILCFSSTIEELAENFYILLCELFLSDNHVHIESKEHIVLQIEKYFNENISENVTLQMLADHMNVSKVYLCRIFKQQKNTTPMDYFTQLKIQRAQQLLEQMPNVPLRVIADMLGFSDVYYFNKVFKRVTGYTPSKSLKS